MRAAVSYAHETHFAGRIVFSGGWAEASAGAQPPPEGCREGDLMLAEAVAAGLDRQAELRAETRSRSTLENLVHTAEDGLLDGYTFGASRPLGLVSHAWHLPRIRFLAGKVLGLSGPALLDVPVPGGSTDGRGGERLAYLAARLVLVGTSDPARLVRRERRLLASLGRASSRGLG